MTRVTVNADTSDIMSSRHWKQRKQRSRKVMSYTRLVTEPARVMTVLLLFTMPPGAFGLMLLMGWNRWETDRLFVACVGVTLLSVTLAGMIAALYQVHLDHQYHNGDWDRRETNEEQSVDREAPPVVASPAQTVRRNGGRDVRQIDRESPYTWNYDGKSYHWSESQIAALKDRVSKRGTRLAASVLGMDASTYSEYMEAGMALDYVANEGSDSKASYYLTPSGCMDWLGLPYPS